MREPFSKMLTNATINFRCGYVVIVGRPNVGKSSLMNELIGTKVSIISRKAQTTRHQITGIQTTVDTQFLYVDTPGFQTHHLNVLNKILNRTVITTLTTADVILYIIEAGIFCPADQKVMALLPPDIPCILVMNKFDCVKDRAIVLSFTQKIAAMHNFAAIVPVSAKLGFQLDSLKSEIRKYLPANLPMFNADKITNCSKKFLAAEIVREKIFHFIGDELPYTSTVLIEKFKFEGTLCRAFVVLMVARDTHKPMVIGKKGARLKNISTQARLDMERLFGCPVYLKIWVRVQFSRAANKVELRAYDHE